MKPAPTRGSTRSIDRRPRRILYAPHEIAGQMGLLARGMRSLGQEALSASYYPSYGDRPIDRVIGSGLGPRARTRRAVFAAGAALRFDLFHFFFGESLLPRGIDLPVLRARGARVIVHFRGSDIRAKGYLIDRTAEPQKEWQRRSLARWRRWAHRILVSTADLTRLVPEAIWIPQTIDLAAWSTRQPSSGGDVFRIVHAPTDPSIKGTEHLRRAVDNLRARGRSVELLVLTGVPHHVVRHEMLRADAGVDQLSMGWYCNTAIEMMATGLPVIGSVDADLRQTFAPDLPLIPADPTTIERRIEDLLDATPGERARLGARGRAYVEDKHEVRAQCVRLLQLYASL